MSDDTADPEKYLHQVAALCWRRDPAVEVLLITSLRTKRWIIPKGWPQGNMSLAHSAATEAWEEAGVVGKISDDAIGQFHYLKRKWGIARPCVVDVFPLRVTMEHDHWAEQTKRERVWLTPEAAAARIEEPALRELMLTFLTAKERSGRR